MANLQPNRFVLQSSNGQIKVDYESTSFIGQRILNLTLGSGPTRHFVGSQVRTLDTEMGTLVTVTTHITVDTGATSFSVLIPDVSLKSIGDHETFATEAIVTTHSGPNSPPTAVHETYQFVPLQGTASFVLSLFEPVFSAFLKNAKRDAA